MGYSSDGVAAPDTGNGRGTERLKNEPHSLDSGARPVFDLTSTQLTNNTERYLADASFSADKDGPAIIMSDISAGPISPIEACRECRGRDTDRGSEINPIPDRFDLALEKTEGEDFNEFEKEFGDVMIDTREQDVSDPLSGYNRFMFHVNDKLYFWVLKPVARVYGAVIPEGGRVGISRFFKNLSFPIRFVNNALQGKLKRVGIETARFAVNTTIGILGLFDPADEWYDLKPYEEDFGQTLGHYGVGDGAPLTLPLLKPSNLRNTVRIIPNVYLHPIDFLSQGSEFINPIFLGAFILEAINRTSLRIGVYENLKKEALDPYTLMRDAYKQNRDARIKE